MKIDFQTDQGIGTRANLGVIVLETDQTLEPEFTKFMSIQGVALYHSRISMAATVSEDTLAQMEKDLPKSCQLLPSPIEFNVIGYGCTSGATVIGPARVGAGINQVFPKAKTTDPLSAIIAAGDALGVTKLGFLTPYVADVSAKMREKLQDHGFAISAFGSFEEERDEVVARIDQKSIKAAAHQVAQQNASDALVISCTSLRCLEIIPELEAELGIPVLSSNQAMAWHMLRLAGVNDELPSFGRLFSQQLSS